MDASDRASHHVPKLSDVLVSVVQNCALSLKSGKSCIDELVVRVGASGDAHEDIRVLEGDTEEEGSVLDGMADEVHDLAVNLGVSLA
jgi:hypothetical protein